MTIRITKLAVVTRLIQLCLTALCAVGIRAVWMDALPIRTVTKTTWFAPPGAGQVEQACVQGTYRLPSQMDENAALALACLLVLALVLVWSFPTIVHAIDSKEVE